MVVLVSVVKIGGSVPWTLVALKRTIPGSHGSAAPFIWGVGFKVSPQVFRHLLSSTDAPLAPFTNTVCGVPPECPSPRLSRNVRVSKSGYPPGIGSGALRGMFTHFIDCLHSSPPIIGSFIAPSEGLQNVWGTSVAAQRRTFHEYSMR